MWVIVALDVLAQHNATPFYRPHGPEKEKISMRNDLSLYKKLQREMISRNLTLSVAESCTGGLISHRITEIPGASGYFKLGIVAYSNEAKTALLGVLEYTLERFGAVSENVAEEMVKGAADVGRSQCAISVTGIAGPGGGSTDKPVGTVYVGLFRSDRRVSKVECFSFTGSRAEIKEITATSAVQAFLTFLSSSK